MKTISEGLVAVITFDNVTSRHHFTIRIEDEVFKEWSCVRCRDPMYNVATKDSLDLKESLDLKLELWREQEDLCEQLETESWPAVLRSL